MDPLLNKFAQENEDPILDINMFEEPDDSQKKEKNPRWLSETRKRQQLRDLKEYLLTSKNYSVSSITIKTVKPLIERINKDVNSKIDFDTIKEIFDELIETIFKMKEKLLEQMATTEQTQTAPTERTQTESPTEWHTTAQTHIKQSKLQNRLHKISQDKPAENSAQQTTNKNKDFNNFVEDFDAIWKVIVKAYFIKVMQSNTILSELDLIPETIMGDRTNGAIEIYQPFLKNIEKFKLKIKDMYDIIKENLTTNSKVKELKELEPKLGKIDELKKGIKEQEYLYEQILRVINVYFREKGKEVVNDLFGRKMTEETIKNNIISKIKEKFKLEDNDSIVKKIQDFIDKKIEEAKKENLENILKGIDTSLKNNLSNVLNKLKEKRYEEILKEFTDEMQQLSAGDKDYKPKIKNLIENTLSKIREKFPDKLDEAKVYINNLLSEPHIMSNLHLKIFKISASIYSPIELLFEILSQNTEGKKFMDLYGITDATKFKKFIDDNKIARSYFENIIVEVIHSEIKSPEVKPSEIKSMVLNKLNLKASNDMNSPLKYKKIYIDLDGVLTDFTKGIHKELGYDLDISRYPYKLGKYEILGDIATKFDLTKKELFDIINTEYFWENLPWTNNGKHVYETIKKVYPLNSIYILTSPLGIPNDNSPEGKFKWVEKNIPELKNHVIITKNKEEYAEEGSLLIDDKDINIEKFIENKGDALLIPRPWNSEYKSGNTVQKLKEKLGFPIDAQAIVADKLQTQAALPKDPYGEPRDPQEIAEEMYSAKIWKEPELEEKVEFTSIPYYLRNIFNESFLLDIIKYLPDFDIKLLLNKQLYLSKTQIEELKNKIKEYNDIKSKSKKLTESAMGFLDYVNFIRDKKLSRSKISELDQIKNNFKIGMLSIKKEIENFFLKNKVFFEKLLIDLVDIDFEIPKEIGDKLLKPIPTVVGYMFRNKEFDDDFIEEIKEYNIDDLHKIIASQSLGEYSENAWDRALSIDFPDEKDKWEIILKENMTKIEENDPKIQEYMKKNGIKSFRSLAYGYVDSDMKIILKNGQIEALKNRILELQKNILNDANRMTEEKERSEEMDSYKILLNVVSDEAKKQIFSNIINQEGNLITDFKNKIDPYINIYFKEISEEDIKDIKEGADSELKMIKLDNIINGCFDYLKNEIIKLIKVNKIFANINEILNNIINNISILDDVRINKLKKIKNLQEIINENREKLKGDIERELNSYAVTQEESILEKVKEYIQEKILETFA